MVTGPDSELVTADRGRLRASHADREQAIEVLKAAFVQDRLDKDELDARVGRALTSRTYADLAALIADLPAGPATAVPATTVPATTVPATTVPATTVTAVSATAGSATAVPSGTPGRTLVKAACRSGMCLFGAMVLIRIAFVTGSGFLGLLAFLGAVAAPIAASGFLGYGAIDAWQQRRCRKQLRSRPGRDAASR
jgi:hypothetical protein